MLNWIVIVSDNALGRFDLNLPRKKFDKLSTTSAKAKFQQLLMSSCSTKDEIDAANEYIVNSDQQSTTSSVR